MDKILVSIYVLTIDEEYDLFVSINETVKESLEIIQNAIKELSGGSYQIHPEANLYSGLDGRVVNPHNLVKFSGLANGARLLLF